MNVLVATLLLLISIFTMYKISQDKQKLCQGGIYNVILFLLALFSFATLCYLVLTIMVLFAI